MAKRQNFIVGSTNVITQSLTDSELNHGFDQYEVLTADELDGVFNSVSDFSNDSSNEIANAIQSITGSQPTGSSQAELAAALQQMRSEIETTSLTFKGYVATSAPSSSTYALVEGNIWINSSTMPTSFPVAASSIKRWNGTSWVNYGSTYTPADFDFFRNINDNEGYYWFGGVWTVMSTDMSTTYFTLNQSTGKWEIKSSVNLPGNPTTTTPGAADKSTKIATTQFAHDFGQRYISNCITEIPQDIKLTLASGTLTLKAGSKVYVPNGSGTFDILTLTVDKTATQSANDSRMYFYNGSYIEKFPASACYSGSTAPSGQQYMFWYDTANNVVKKTYNSGSTWESGWSLPFCIATASGGALTGIDQVFNGFGYIGSTVFALPGVKVLIPNGKNTDGTLKNISVTNGAVRTTTVTNNGDLYYLFRNTAQQETTDSYAVEYNNTGAARNYCLSTNTLEAASGTIFTDRMIAAFLTVKDYKITSLTPKTVFQAGDYGDSISRYAKQDVNGSKTLLDTSPLRFIGGNNNYGIIFHTNQNKFYMLLTDQNDARGNFNSLRPFSLDCATGTISTTTPATTDKSTKIATTEYTRSLLETIYPVGSLYFGTQSTCPLASLFGTWTRVPSGYALWTGNGTNEVNSNTPNGTTTNANYANAKPNTTIAAGVPNLTGSISAWDAGTQSATGVFSATDRSSGHGWEGTSNHRSTYSFDASQGGTDTVYGKSSTVQPPAYIINVWRRTA